MSLRRLVLSVALLLALVGPVALSRPAPAGAASSISVTISCRQNPEKVTVKNNGSSRITIYKVGSLYQPRSNEPFSVTVRVQPGAKVTFQAGAAASGTHKLTNQFIFNNTVGTTEGVKIKTGSTTVVKRCTANPSSGGSNGGGGSSNCDPNYTGACIPVYPPDVDCSQISARNFNSIGSDPHGLDRDNDGKACES